MHRHVDLIKDYCRRFPGQCRAALGVGCEPSPWAHIYRLVLLLAIALLAFLQIKSWAMPDSWDPQGWHRAAAVTELQRLPLSFSRRESCIGCHEQRREDFLEGAHKALSCESCHGPSAQHVKGEVKTGNAQIDRSRDACLLCHRKLVSRPQDFPQFQPTFHKQMGVDDAKQCSECHQPHAPSVQFGF